MSVCIGLNGYRFPIVGVEISSSTLAPFMDCIVSKFYVLYALLLSLLLITSCIPPLLPISVLYFLDCSHFGTARCAVCRKGVRSVNFVEGVGRSVQTDKGKGN